MTANKRVWSEFCLGVIISIIKIKRLQAKIEENNRNFKMMHSLLRTKTFNSKFLAARSYKVTFLYNFVPFVTFSVES